MCMNKKIHLREFWLQVILPHLKDKKNIIKCNFMLSSQIYMGIYV